MRFELCVTIDPGQFSFSPNHTEFSPIHWLAQDELIESAAYKEEEGLNFSDSPHPSFTELRLNNKRATSSKKKRLLEVISDTPDLLFNVHSDGSIVLWGIKVYNRYVYIIIEKSHYLTTVESM
jgi:hypothetical protein